MLYIKQSVILKDVLTPNNFFILKIICRRKIYKNFYRLFYLFFSYFKNRFCCGMLKQRNFLQVVDLSFDARFVKYYPFSLHCHKQYPINNIQVKCSQIGQNVSDIFLTYSLQIVSDKLIRLMISSFWSCD